MVGHIGSKVAFNIFLVRSSVQVSILCGRTYLKSHTFVSGKAKPYPSEMEKVAQDEIKSKLNEIEAALNDGDHALDEKIKTVNLNLESVKNGMTDQIEQVNVSLKIIDGKDLRERSRWGNYV